MFFYKFLLFFYLIPCMAKKLTHSCRSSKPSRDTALIFRLGKTFEIETVQLAV